MDASRQRRCRGGRGRPAGAHRAVVGAPSRAKGGWRRADREPRGGAWTALTPNERTECFQIAAYRTRTPKLDADTPTAELRAHWRTEADAWFLVPNDGSGHQQPTCAPGGPPAQKVVAEVIGRLEEQSATWGRAEVVEEVSRFVSATTAEGVRECVEVLTERVLADAEVVSLAGPLPAEPPESLRRRDGTAAVERHGAVRFSTRATLRREAAILEEVDAGRDAHAAVVDELTVDRVLADPSLGGDQREQCVGCSPVASASLFSSVRRARGSRAHSTPRVAPGRPRL